MNKLIIIISLVLTSFTALMSQSEISTKAKALYNKEDYKGAIKLYNKAVEENKAGFMDFYYRGNSFLMLRSYQEAYNDFTTCIERSGNFAEAYYLRGSILINSNQIYPAINDFEMAIKYAKNDTIKSISYYARAGAKLYTQNYESAIKDCLESLKIDSTSHRSKGAYVNLSTCYGYLNRKDESIAILKRMYLKDSTDLPIIGNLGYELTQMEKYEESIYYFDRALKLFPNDGYVLSNKSYAYLKMGKAKEALELINKSVKFDPTNSFAYKNMGLIYLALKEKQKACDAFNTAIKKGFTEMYGNEVLKLKKENCSEY